MAGDCLLTVCVIGLLQDHSHTPWLVILYKYLQDWKNSVSMLSLSPVFFIICAVRCTVSFLVAPETDHFCVMSECMNAVATENSMEEKE